MHVFGAKRPKNEAPLLDSFFSNPGLGESLNYCAICLRTENERRMVSNSILVTFTNIIVMNKVWQHGSICYVCEKQAQQATRFIMGFSFAATIDTVFKEILIQKHILNKDVFQNNIFRCILEKFNLAGKKLLPRQWEADLRDVRYATEDSTATPEASTPQVDRFTPKVAPFTPKDDPVTPQVSDSGKGKGNGKGKGKRKGRLVSQPEPSSTDTSGANPVVTSTEPSPSDTHLMPPPGPDIMTSTASLASRSRPPTRQNKDPDPATLETRKSGRTAEMFRSRLSSLVSHADVFEIHANQTRPRSYYHMRKADKTRSRGGRGTEESSAADQPDISGTVKDGSDKGHNGRVDQPGLSCTVDDSGHMDHGGDVDQPGGSEDPNQADIDSSSAKNDEGNNDAVVLPLPQPDSETVAVGADKDGDQNMEEVVPHLTNKVDEPQTTDWECDIPAIVLSSMNAVTPRPDPILTPVASQVIRPFPPVQMKRRPSILRSPVNPNRLMITAVNMTSIQTPQARYAKISTEQFRNTAPWMRNAGKVPRTKKAEKFNPNQMHRPQVAVDPNPRRVTTPNTFQMLSPQIAEDSNPSRVMTPNTFQMIRAQNAGDRNPSRVINPNIYQMLTPQDSTQEEPDTAQHFHVVYRPQFMDRTQGQEGQEGQEGQVQDAIKSIVCNVLDFC